MNIFSGQKRELEDESNQSANFKKLKNDLGLLFGGSQPLGMQHSTVVSFRELTLLDDKVCFISYLRFLYLYIYVNACNTPASAIGHLITSGVASMR